jgi:hypothetical protein
VPLLLREAPGHAVEESLFDVSQTVANRSATGGLLDAIQPGSFRKRFGGSPRIYAGETRASTKTGFSPGDLSGPGIAYDFAGAPAPTGCGSA